MCEYYRISLAHHTEIMSKNFLVNSSTLSDSRFDHGYRSQGHSPLLVGAREESMEVGHETRGSTWDLHDIFLSEHLANTLLL